MGWRETFNERVRHVKASNRYLSRSAVEECILYDCAKAMIEAHPRGTDIVGILTDPEKQRAIELACSCVKHTDTGEPRKYRPGA